MSESFAERMKRIRDETSAAGASAPPANAHVTQPAAPLETASPLSASIGTALSAGRLHAAAESSTAAFPEPSTPPVDLARCEAAMASLRSAQARGLVQTLLARLKRYGQDIAGTRTQVEAGLRSDALSDILDCSRQARQLALLDPAAGALAKRAWTTAKVATENAGVLQNFTALEREFLGAPFVEPERPRVNISLLPDIPEDHRALLDTLKAALAADPPQDGERAALDLLDRDPPAWEIVAHLDLFLQFADDSPARTRAEDHCLEFLDHPPELDRAALRRQAQDRTVHLAADAVVEGAEALISLSMGSPLASMEVADALIGAAGATARGLSNGATDPAWAKQVEDDRRALVDRLRGMARLPAARALRRSGTEPERALQLFLDAAGDREKLLDWAGAWNIAIESGDDPLIGAYEAIIGLLRGPAGFDER